MKLTVFMDGFYPYHETKDPGQIPLGLKEIGIKTELVTIRKKELEDYKGEVPITQVTENDVKSIDFWSKNDSDTILVYTWLTELYNPLLETIKLASKKVLVKADSDGRIGYPLRPYHLNTPLIEELTFERLTERLWMRLPFRFLHKRGITVAMKRIKQIELCDGVVIESPEALENLKRFLTIWGRQDLINKTHFVPNPVTPDFISSEIKQKENIVVAYGRWNDLKQKNTAAMVKSIVAFLQKKPEYRAIIFGEGKEIIQNLIQNIPSNVFDRLQVLGFVERQRINQILSNAKIFFIPSRWESFGIAAGESVCMGCSLVATPLESFQYLCMQGFSGTISSNFTKESLLDALIQDASKWDQGRYDPEAISKFWRARLDRKIVAESIANIAQKL